MAVPLLAGAMAVVMGFDARDARRAAVPGLRGGILAIAAIVYVCQRTSDRIVSALGEAGADALTRILRLIVLAIGVELVIHGIVEHGAVVSLGKHWRRR
jgi:multiple antibiotic resistance protein